MHPYRVGYTFQCKPEGCTHFAEVVIYAETPELAKQAFEHIHRAEAIYVEEP